MSAAFLSLFFGTFVLEDVALITGVAMAASGQISVQQAFWACFLGIAVGDIGVYLIGWLAVRVGFIARSRIFLNLRSKFSNIESEGLMSTAVFVCRFIPGTRVVTYALAGFAEYSFVNFFVLTIVSVLLWVWLAFAAGVAAQQFFKEHLVLALLALVAGIWFVRFLIKNMRGQWQRKIFFHSWRKWLSFEFWPPWLFYIPIVPRYIFLALRYRSFVLPFYANPFIEHAGLIGESKWDFYRHLQENDFNLRTSLVQKSENQQVVIADYLAQGLFSYPFILKPDKGQRGFAVRIIRDESELNLYLSIANFDLIVQEFCDWNHEAGLFYIREPETATGRLFSITDKEFPWVTGDGNTRLGDLILQDSRARIIAATYFSRFQAKVNSVPALGEKICISTCGNHCQGAIFKDGRDLNSPKLLAAVEKLVQQLPDFYFGRLDIRYLNQEALKAGRNFKIVEINGAGSEATHIWDPQTSLLEAYRVLFEQWGILFEIGHQIKEKQLIQYKFNFLKFVTELLNLKQQEKKLAVSS